MDPKYSFGIKLVLAGAVVLVAAYFGTDISAMIGGLLGNAPATPTLPTP